MQALERLRLRLTLWYAGTFAVILALLGVWLFVVIARQIDARMDRSVVKATREIMRAAHIREREAAGAGGAAGARGPVVDALDELRIPDRQLFLFDGAADPVKPAAADERVRAVAREALTRGVADREFVAAAEHTMEVHAERFRLSDGKDYVAVTVADREELENEYAGLIAAFAGAALVALAMVTVGGWLLARKSTEPVQRTLEQMRQFMADAAHELRTPITVLRTRADVALQRERDPAAYAAALGDIGREASRMGGIVEDLLTLARADAGERPVRRERCFLDDIVLDAVGAARPLAQGQGVALEVARYEEAPVDGDPALLRQLAMILLDNAIAYTAAGGSVKVAVHPENGRAALVVEDTGSGIPREALPHIFERFYRADPAHGRRNGAGLGLAIARWIVDAHQAEIDVASEVGKGTRVSLRFVPALSSS